MEKAARTGSATAIVACAGDGVNSAPASVTQDVRAYLAAHWDDYLELMQRTNQWPSGALEFVTLDDLLCTPAGGAISCEFVLTARGPGGTFTSSRTWGQFAYHDGQLGEVIIVG